MYHTVYHCGIMYTGYVSSSVPLCVCVCVQGMYQAVYRCVIMYIRILVCIIQCTVV